MRASCFSYCDGGGGGGGVGGIGRHALCSPSTPLWVVRGSRGHSGDARGSSLIGEGERHQGKDKQRQGNARSVWLLGYNTRAQHTCTYRGAQRGHGPASSRIRFEEAGEKDWDWPRSKAKAQKPHFQNGQNPTNELVCGFEGPQKAKSGPCPPPPRL
jgi:hypothetical protein